MSTKTTFKRIALVAVASLGFGMLSVVPSSATAAEETVASLSVGASTPARVGLATTTTITARYAAALDSGDTITVAARVLTAPAGSGFKASTASTGITSNSGGAILAWSASASGYTDSEANADYTKVSIAGQDYVATSSDFTVTSAGATAGTKTLGSYLTFTPDVEGTYTILVSSMDSAYASGNPTAVWTVTVAGAPAKVTLTTYGNNADIDGANGSLVKVVLTDAAGTVTMPGTGEYLNLTSSDSDVDIFSAAAGSGEISTLSSSNGFTTYGFGYFWVKTAAAATEAQTSTITVSGGGLLSSAVSSSVSITHRDAAAAATFYLGDGTTDADSSTDTPAGYEYASATSFDVAPSVTSHIFQISGLTASATTAAYYPAVVTDEDGTISGIVGAVYDTVLTRAAGTSTVASVTISASLGTSKSFQLGSIDLDGETAVQDSVAIDQPSLRSADGGSIALTAVTYDQFGLEMPSVGVTFSVAGRNTVAGTLKVSDADGIVSFSYTDAGTSATTNKLDTITATPNAGDDDSMTVTFGAYTVGTVTVTGGATADTVAYPAAGATTAAISTAKAGAAGATTTFTATVKDANGNTLSGVPVTWSVDQATAGITKSLTSDSASCYTGAAGTCTTTVFAWAAPLKVTVTATAGGVSGTGYQNFVNAAADARVLSGTVSGAVVTAKVVDRYGNPVAGVTVSAKTSNGYFGNGATSTTGETTTDGTVGFAVQAAAATVTLSVNSATYGQTDDLAGYVGTSAVTAAVAGTTTGVGASLAPAGVNSVAVEVTEGGTSVAQAAADAAAEATDAANAATDAANAAAEAADAATAAAQDAADAVAALSTQVSEMVNALKKQITALTNLVIKIQKKVKA